MSQNAKGQAAYDTYWQEVLQANEPHRQTNSQAAGQCSRGLPGGVSTLCSLATRTSAYYFHFCVGMADPGRSAMIICIDWWPARSAMTRRTPCKTAGRGLRKHGNVKLRSNLCCNDLHEIVGARQNVLQISLRSAIACNLLRHIQ